MRVIFITLHTFLSWLIANIPGGIGQKVRFFYWKYKFLSCGKNVRIDQGVIFHNPENIIIGLGINLTNIFFKDNKYFLPIRKKILKNISNFEFIKKISQTISDKGILSNLL